MVLGVEAERLITVLTGDRGLYPWQRRFLQDWVGREGEGVACPWRAVDIPTGLGKTTLITLWLIARLLGAPAPRRLVYVVDRRAVVDQATEEAERLARAQEVLLADATPADAARWRERLGLQGEATDLPISTLRGQRRDNRRWFADPAACAIVVGTVDMIGSRLLFQGYRLSRWMRPVHAALIGTDSLLVLDEAHLALPFQRLLREGEARAGREAQDGAPMRPFHLLSLSATGRDPLGVFRLDGADEADPRVRARLDAPKRLRLTEEVAKDGAARLAKEAWDLREAAARPDDGARVVVFCRSRLTAQQVKEALDRQVKATYGKGAVLTELLVGERRGREREARADKPVFARFRPDGPVDPDRRPAFLVATSAGEVGVDLDADHLVCDLAPFERMVQRLGRVNRRRDPGVAEVVVVPLLKEKEPDEPVEDGALERWRAPFRVWPQEPGGWRDASPGRLAALLADETPATREAITAALTPEPLRPPLVPATLENWALSSLPDADHTGRPRVEPWLRGWVETIPQTALLWRRWLPLQNEEVAATADLRAFLDTAPPEALELLEAPTWRVVKLVQDRARAWTKAQAEPSDEAAAEEPTGEEGSRPAHPPAVVVLAPDGTLEEVYTLDRLAGAPDNALERRWGGRTVILDARLGGLDRDGLLDLRASHAPATADGSEPWAGIPWRVTPGRRPPKPDPEPKGERWVLADFRWAREGSDLDGLWVEVRRDEKVQAEVGDPALSRRPQGLSDHHQAARRQAERLAQALRLPDGLARALALAAAHHDLGKDRELWQDAMGADGEGRPYAKTGGGGDGRALNGYRHEFGSLLDLQRGAGAEALAGLDEDARDLVLHLVTTHHGRGRGWLGAYDPDPREPPSRLGRHAHAALLRHVRLQRRWGVWGLAWLEALVRAADGAASAELERGEPPGG